jgi:hypothetical protein
VSNGQLILFGTDSTEFWAPSQDLNQAYSLIQGTAIQWGCAAVWSIARYDNTLMLQMKNPMGEVMIAKLAGYVPQKVSNPDIDKIINAYTNSFDESAYSFMLGGHPMYVANFPSAGETWVFDGSTSMWWKKKSYGLSRDFAEFGFSFLGTTVVADYSNGRLYRQDPDVLTDNGNPIEAQITSENIASPDLNRFTVNRFRLDVQVGVGTTNGQGEDPQIGLEVSRDNGKTWGAQMWRTLGRIGDYIQTVDWDRLGTARNFVFRLSVTDPVQFTLLNAILNPDD